MSRPANSTPRHRGSLPRRAEPNEPSEEVSYQEERSVGVVRGVLHVCERLAPERAAGNVEGQSQGQVVLGVDQQTEIGAENPPHRRFHLLMINRRHIGQTGRKFSRIQTDRWWI